jgi:hypothetical protein
MGALRMNHETTGRYAYGGGDPDIHVGSHDLWETISPAFDVVPHLVYATDYYAAVAVGIINATGEAWRRHEAAAQAGVATTVPSPFFMFVWMHARLCIRAWHCGIDWRVRVAALSSPQLQTWRTPALTVP